MAEPWLSGSHTDVPAVPRAVIHALELAKDDLWKWCAELSEEQLNEKHGNVPAVAFHVRHIAGSMDRLLTYAEGGQLSAEQVTAMQAEQTPAKKGEVFADLDKAFARSAERVKKFSSADLEQSRSVGKKQLPTTVAGLLVHVADHTQRHVGQAVTTAKLVSQK